MGKDDAKELVVLVQSNPGPMELFSSLHIRASPLHEIATSLNSMPDFSRTGRDGIDAITESIPSIRISSQGRGVVAVRVLLQRNGRIEAKQLFDNIRQFVLVRIGGRSLVQHTDPRERSDPLVVCTLLRGFRRPQCAGAQHDNPETKR